MLGLGIFITSSTLWLLKTINISRPIKRLNLIFDLDNTLIMSLELRKYSRMNNLYKPDIYLTNRVVWIRPWVHQVLWIMSKFCNLYLFTRAEKQYADSVLSGFKIEHYFKKCKYKPDCGIDSKDIRCFSSSYEKLIEYYPKINKLKDRFTEKQIIKILKSIKSHNRKMEKFVSQSVLIDDQNTNNIEGQHFYHINFYHFGMSWDYQMIKLLGWICWKSIVGLN